MPSWPLRRLVLLSFCVAGLFAQGDNTTAKKDDWEEINFETGSAVLTDGYPSLLRLAELLSKNPTYRVRVEGHTDSVGSRRSNEKLGMARAQAVKSFLEKYGARPDQITAATQGMNQPKVENRTKEGRWMNRRTIVNVTDGTGKTISDGGVGDAIRNLNQATGGPAAAADPKCCDEILKRLDKLDDILALLRTMKTDHDKLAAEVDRMKGEQARLANQPPPVTKEDLAAAQNKTVEDTVAKLYNPRWSVLGANAGMDNLGRLTFTGKGRFFAPFGKSTAIQSEGEYMYFRDRQEGQFDLGIVNRWSKVQMGLFSSFKHVNMREMQTGGTLGQAALTVDYIFSRGKVGIFGTKSFLNNAVVNRAPLTGSGNVILETYLRVVDQVGGSTSFALWKDSYAEANLGFLRTYGGSNKPGGTIRLVQPVNNFLALSLEGGFNETLVTRNSTGSVRVGVLFGNWLRPKNYGSVETPVPVDIPRVRYEMLTRRVRTGNDAPVADAGGDQVGVAAGTVTLDGSGSYDPDGDPLTYEWRQVAGPAVTVNNATAAIATFAAAEGATYAFRLTVKDDHGAQGTARATVTVRQAQPVAITSFVANPTSVSPGQPVTLSWTIQNATEAQIGPAPGAVNAQQGSVTVSPTQTTTYTLTARNASSEATQSVTVTVQAGQARIVAFAASPANINAGQASTLTWQTENATEVSISGVGAVQPNGSTSVSPAATTTYTITARNSVSSATATAVVTVGATGLPTVRSFTASPTNITAGSSSTLAWAVDNATNVTITSLGTVSSTASSPVSPTATTTYTLTATNSNGSVNATVTVTVSGVAPTFTACAASPTQITTSGQPVTLTFSTTNATGVTLNGSPITSPFTVNPGATTTYTLIANGAGGQTAQCQVTVTFPPGQPPVANPGTDRFVNFRSQILDGGQSTDPQGRPLTYSWRVIQGQATISAPTERSTQVYLGNLPGPYVFELTVTNSAGQSSTATVTLNLAFPSN